MTLDLCHRCANCIRTRNIVRKISESGETRTGCCQNCKTHTFISTYDIHPKRKE
jgi:hypothetical protein